MGSSISKCSHDKLFYATTYHGQIAWSSKGYLGLDVAVKVIISLIANDGKVYQCYLCRQKTNKEMV